MFENLFNAMKGRLRGLKTYKTIEEALGVNSPISPVMRSRLDLWQKLFQDEAPWIDPKTGIYSAGISGEICNKLAKSVTLEMQVNVLDPDKEDKQDDDLSTEIRVDTRAHFLNDTVKHSILDKIREFLEQGMAVGGMILKPYISGNNIYVDISPQSEFIPLAFSDDNKITEIAFIDSFTRGEYIYTKIEHHKFDKANKTVIIKNRAFQNKTTNRISPELGKEVDLITIPEWAQISPEVEIRDVERPLYGYYRVPLSNHVDRGCPLGVSVYSRAVTTIERADMQYSRLDWEYEGGQLAIDVDPTALKGNPNTKNYPDYISKYINKLPKLSERIFRKVDLNQDDTYNVFAPSLRDASYINGLDRYLMRIEDQCSLYRGCLSQDTNSSNYQNEQHLLVNRQNYYTNVTDNQAALQKCLQDVIYAINTYTTLYNLAPEGKFTSVFSWDDSIINDPSIKLDEKLKLKRENILSPGEVRSWYTGETLEKAQSQIDEITKKQQEQQLDDIFTKSLE